MTNGRVRWNWNTLYGLFITFVIYTISYEIRHPLSLAWLLPILALSTPIKYEGNFYSLWGGFAPTGHIYSLVGLFQRSSSSEGNTYALIGIIQSSENEARAAVGFLIFQEATRGTALHGFGISLFQYGTKSAQICGFSVYKQGTAEVEQVTGITIYQTAPRIIERTFVITLADW